MTQAERRVRVDLGARGYDAVIAPGALARAREFILASLAQPPHRIFIAADAALPAHTVDALARSFGGAARLSLGRIPAAEAHKSMRGADELLAALADARLERADLLIALGGGAVGDLAGFAAGIYRRGIPWIACPTTLLAMVDASVGGKTGVNLLARGEVYKNMIGVVHQPAAVLIDPDVLESMPQRSFRSGLAECAKHCMLAGAWGDDRLWDWTLANIGPVLARDPGALPELIARNIAVKARIVQADERETADEGIRAQLNLGHTFGHALEGLSNLSPTANPTDAPLQHGEAVALGLVAAARCAAAAGICPGSLPAEVESLISACSLPARIANLPRSADVIARMMHDKKVAGGKLRLVLPTSRGRCGFFADVPRSAIETGIDALRC
jgi:3-dehydroquinate synthetase